MVLLRPFTQKDLPQLRALDSYAGCSDEKLLQTIRAWESKEYRGRYFETLAVEAEEGVAGLVSLYQRTTSAVSLGVEIDPHCRRKGYGYAACAAALDHARRQGWKIAVSQVGQDNAPSLALHRKLGFEIEHGYVNAKGHEVWFLLKALA